MSFIPPPPPLNYQDWKKQYDKGYRTLEELDPEFAKWSKSNRKQQLFFGIGLVMYILFMILILWWL